VLNVPPVKVSRFARIDRVVDAAKHVNVVRHAARSKYHSARTRGARNLPILCSDQGRI
jgi:hypothetical protein